MAKKSTVAPEEMQKWLSKIKRAEAVRNDADNRYGYSRAILEYQNDYASAMPSFIANTDIIPINEVYAYMKAFVPSIYSRDPFIAINPKGYKSIAGAKILELAINSYWRELKLKREIRRSLYDAGFAEGWVKVGYTANIEDEDESRVEPSEFIRNEEIFASRVSWRNMVRDPDAVNGLHDARWVAQNIIKPLEVVKASSLYENTSDLAASLVSNWQSDPRQKLVPYRDEVEYVSLWEVWDRDNQKVFTVSEGHAKYLMNKDWPYKIQGFPYALLRFNENPDEPYAPNLIASWEPQLWEKIKIRAMQMDHIKRFGRQLAAEEGSMSRAEMDKFAQGRTGSVVFYKKGKSAPVPVPYPPVQTDIYGIESRIDLDKDNVSGQPNAVRSAPQRTQSRTLGEIDRLITAFQSRQSDPQAMVEEFAEEVATKLIGLMQQYLSGDKFVRATQKDIQEISQALVDPVTGESRFDGNGFRFSRKDIQDIEFDLDVRAGSTLPLDKQTRAETMVNLLKLGPTLGIQPGGRVSRVLGKSLLSDFELKEVEQAYDEEMREIENQKIMANAAASAKVALDGVALDNARKSVENFKNGGGMPAPGGIGPGDL